MSLLPCFLLLPPELLGSPCFPASTACGLRDLETAHCLCWSSAVQQEIPAAWQQDGGDVIQGGGSYSAAYLHMPDASMVQQVHMDGGLHNMSEAYEVQGEGSGAYTAHWGISVVRGDSQQCATRSPATRRHSEIKKPTRRQFQKLIPLLRHLISSLFFSFHVYIHLFLCQHCNLAWIVYLPDLFLQISQIHSQTSLVNQTLSHSFNTGSPFLSHPGSPFSPSAPVWVKSFLHMNDWNYTQGTPGEISPIPCTTKSILPSLYWKYLDRWPLGWFLHLS